MDTLQDIENEIDKGIAQVFDSPNASKHADWKLWRSIFAGVMQILNRNKTEVEQLAESRHAGNIDWYYAELMKFQGGSSESGTFEMDELVVDNLGVVRFSNADESRQIITHMSLTENENGTLKIKAAKTEADKVVSLENDERLAFEAYIKRIKYPGLKYLLTADNPDLICFDMTVYHNSTNANDVLAEILEVIQGYQETLGFNDEFYTQRFVEYIRTNVAEVVTIKLNSLKAKADLATAFNDVDVVYTLQAGYFNFQAEDANKNPSIINMKHIDELVL